MRNLVLRGSKGSSSFSLFLEGASIERFVVTAESSGGDRTKVHAGWESESNSSYNLIGLSFRGNESKARLRLNFSKGR